MHRTLILLGVLAFLLGAPGFARADIDYSGGNGKSIEKAVIISGAHNDREFIGAEDYWVRDHYDNVAIYGQGPLIAYGHRYSMMRFLADGKIRTLYFRFDGPGED